MLIALSPLGASADIIYFKDGMKTICQEKAWEENGEIKCEYEGVVLIYSKTDVLRIQKISRSQIAQINQKFPQAAQLKKSAYKPHPLNPAP